MRDENFWRSVDEHVQQLLKDPRFIGNHPALKHVGTRGPSSESLQGDADPIVTVADQLLEREEVPYIDPAHSSPVFGGSDASPEETAKSIVHRLQLKLLCLAASMPFVETSESLGSELEWDCVSDARITLIGHNKPAYPGAIACILHPTRWMEIRMARHLIHDLPESSSIFRYQGQFDGVDIYTSRCLLQGLGGCAGRLLGPGAVVWADAPSQCYGDRTESLNEGRILLTFNRDSSAATTRKHCYAGLGVSIGDGDAGVDLVVRDW